MEVIGAAGAILGIIDVATRSISTLLDVKKRFKEANLTLELLSSQLLTVKAALEQIHAIINETLRGDEQHYSLIMSMDSTIKCCNLLIRLLDENIAKLEYSENDALSFENRVRLVLDSKGIEECQSRLDRQINALNLILTAFQWYEDILSVVCLPADLLKSQYSKAKGHRGGEAKPKGLATDEGRHNFAHRALRL